MTQRRGVRRATAPALVLLALLAACAAPRSTTPVQVKILAINDFHGNLKPPQGGIRIRDPQDPSKTINVPAGGSEHMASALNELRAKNPNHIFVAAGDLVGATPLVSALFHDEPTIEAMNLMGLEASAVGNHEFDKGQSELLRLQRGGCHPADGCKGPRPFGGARFQYLGAGIVDTRSGQNLLPSTHIKRFQGIPVAFIGLTLKDTPTIVVPAGVAHLKFGDEAETINALVPGLRQQGIEAIVVLIHEGGMPTGDYNECPGISGPIVDIVRKLDRAVDVVISGHTHRAYNCRIDDRLVTSADRYGTVVSEIDITLDPGSGDVTQARADNLIVRTDRFAKDAAQSKLIATYEQLAAPLAKRVVGRVGAPLTRDESPSGEMPVGLVIADAQLAATGEAGAQLALMNPGGVRANLNGDASGQVRYEDLFAVQPFYNNLVTVTLTGAQLQLALEQQWLNQPRPRVLQVSRGFSYTWDASKPPGQRVVPGSLRLHGAPIEPQQRLRVTINNFLAGGGDNFSVFKRDGQDPRTGIMDIDAFERYVAAQGTVSPVTTPRVQRMN
ncbi:MAG: bifunctional metallophosphatase/5'-nucleotidase [Burkholderiaceae bacterium]|nr:bifunctional metallophosphatase/5'-nucleotidase [Burkholderiaceae bacterium]